MKNKHHSPAEHFTTKPSEGGCAITGYTDPGGDVVIPGVIGGEKVVEIRQETFNRNDSLTSIVIPDSVTRIDQEAFHNCSVLTCVTLPASITHISTSAFSRCLALTLRVPAGSYAHQYAIDHAIPFELI